MNKYGIDGKTVTPGKIWRCVACGKRARTRYGFDTEGKNTILDDGYDESCMLNSELVDEVCFFACPPGHKCEHEWDGPGQVIYSTCIKCDGEGSVNGIKCGYCDGKGEYHSGESSTCSKCGMSAIDYSLWNCS